MKMPDLAIQLYSRAVPVPSRLVNLFLISATLALAACSSLPTDVQRTPSYALPDTSSTRLASDIQPLVEAHAGLSGFHVLNDGVDAFATRLRIIQAADESIDAQYYIWHTDLTGNAMYNQLLHAADRGVRVRILLDDLDTAGKDDMLHLIDAHPNVEVRLYNPFANRGMRAGDFVTDARRVNHRMHTKTLTVDNQVAVFGGRNIGDEYFAAAKDVGFSDMDALAIGPVVPEVSSQFDLFWNSEWVYPVNAFPRDEPVTQEAVKAFRKLSDEQMSEARSSEYADIIRQLDSLAKTSFAELDMSWSEWQLAYDLPSNVVEKEITAEANLAPELKEFMERTEKELDIVSPYFVPGEKFTQALTNKAKEGVRVRILTNSLASNDVSLVHAGYMRYREDLIAGGVDLYELKAVRNREWEEKMGKDKIGAKKASLHAKFFGFDRRFLFIGSFNLDPRSKVLNTEFGAYFESPDNARRMTEFFDQQMMLVAYRVQLDEDGELEWITLNENGQEQRVDHEPDTTFWKRFNTRILSPIVPESQL
jgi:putative cardiolipin synthase